MAETPEIAGSYEPPGIERVVTPEDLEWEVLYAGEPGPSQVDLPA
jgi:hypothetical protein